MSKVEDVNPNLRVSADLKEIGRILKKMYNNNFKVTVWQNHGDERVVSTAFIQNLNKLDKTISVKPSGVDKFEFNKRFSIYIHGEEQSILFKTDATYNNDKLLVFNIPRKIRLLEKRADPRVAIVDKLHNEVVFDKFQGFKETPNEYVFVALDISCHGMAFRIFSHDLTQFTVGNQLFLKSICGQKFTADFKAEVMYIKSYSRNVQFGTSNVFRVGVQFNKKLHKDTISQLSDIA